MMGTATGAARRHGAGRATGERETGTIARTVLVLRAVAQAAKEPTMKELAETLNLPMSTTHRLLDLLAQKGMVERDDTTRTFRPGFEFFRLASLVVHRMPLKNVARPFLVEAARESGESSYLCLLEEPALKLLFIAHAESGKILDYRVPLNVPYALSVGASGLAVLAWLTRQQVERVLAAENADGERDNQSITKALADVRKQGYAHTFGQRMKGAVGFFAPVFDAADNACASFGFTVPESRYDKRHRQRLGQLAMIHAGLLSQAIGYAGEYPRLATSYVKEMKATRA